LTRPAAGPTVRRRKRRPQRRRKRRRTHRREEGLPVAPRISIADLADSTPGLPGLDEAGQLPGPLLTVGLGATPGAAAPGPAVLARATDRARGCDRLLAGIAAGPLPASFRPLLAALDLTLTAAGDFPECVTVPDPEAEAIILNEAAAASPQASLVLSQVLRATQDLPVSAALQVESFAYSMLLGGAEFRRWLETRPARPAPPPAPDPVAVRRDGPRLLITLSQPQRRNAYSRALRDALTDALRVALLDPAISRVVLDGAGPCFSSGGDLDEFGTTPDPVTAHLVRTLAGAGRLIRELGPRIEVRVHGPCTGAGVELAAFAGTVVAAEQTTFRLPEIGMGLIPGAGGTVSIPRRIGRWRTLYLALTGRAISAATALAWGLADQVAAGATVTHS
jgi:enoyl-CoA hydratase/carnithine racemase